MEGMNSVSQRPSGMLGPDKNSFDRMDRFTHTHTHTQGHNVHMQTVDIDPMLSFIVSMTIPAITHTTYQIRPLSIVVSSVPDGKCSTKVPSGFSRNPESKPCCSTHSNRSFCRYISTTCDRWCTYCGRSDDFPVLLPFGVDEVLLWSTRELLPMPRVAALHRVAARLVLLLLALTLRATKEENMVVVVVVVVVKEALSSVSFVTGSRTERPMKREKERDRGRL